MKTAVGYLRVSGRGQQICGHGLDRQRQVILEWAKAHGYTIVRWYTDAYTGTESDRPEFMRMLADLMANGCKTVVCESLDRFSRDLLIQSSLLAKMASEGLTLISASTGEDVTAAVAADPMRRALVQIQGVFAELDKNLLVRKLRKGRETKRAKIGGGKVEGRKAYGEKEGEAEVVQRILKLRRKPRGGRRKSFATIADELNAAKIPTRYGGAWKPGTVASVVSRHSSM